MKIKFLREFREVRLHSVAHNENNFVHAVRIVELFPSVRDNRATGTILGAIAGGLIGGFASHGNGLATVGGVIGGGVLGNVIAGDMDCEDRGQAYPIYVDSLNGDIGRPYEWRRGPNRGTFTSIREYRRGGQICREFTATTWRGGNNHTRTGVACREVGDRGGWRFD